MPQASPIREKELAPPGAGRPSVLLSMADYLGTLAAVRSLGRAGVRVRVAEWRWLPPARWSRHVSEVLRCPDAGAAPDQFIAWLLDAGARTPGQVLLATNDDLAWLFARHREELARVFQVDLPPLETMDTVLNKWRLRQACDAVGLQAPASWLPRSDADLRDLAGRARYPLLVKPQTQAFLRPGLKGIIAAGPDELLAAHRAFRDRTRYAPLLLAHDPEVATPMVQAFTAVEAVYSLAGFAGRSGDDFVVAASRKVRQWPLRTGVGLCFEEAALDEVLADRVAALCRHIGYHGVFEAEFIRGPEGDLLIDFNPRFYGQMGFDIARGLDLPLLAYLAASGQEARLREELAVARDRVRQSSDRVYCHRVRLVTSLGLLRLVGRIDTAEVRRWLGWMEAHRPQLVEAVLSADDWGPGLADLASTVIHHARHIRSELRAAREA